jgi:hypothetical protein
MAALLNEERLAEQAGATRPGLFAGIARGWIDALPGAAARIRAATPADLPGALHELRSGAVAVGLSELPAALAAVEQAAEAGRPPDGAALDGLIALAGRSAAALGAWWDAAA